MLKRDMFPHTVTFFHIGCTDNPCDRHVCNDCSRGTWNATVISGVFFQETIGALINVGGEYYSDSGKVIIPLKNINGKLPEERDFVLKGVFESVRHTSDVTKLGRAFKVASVTIHDYGGSMANIEVNLQ